MQLTSKPHSIEIHQCSYIEALQPIHLDKARMSQTDTVLNSREMETYRSKVGQILWVARQSRPDVVYEAYALASSMKRATMKNLIEVNKVIRKLKSEKVTLKFQNVGYEDLKLVVYSDASLGNLDDGGTQGGHIVMLAGEQDKFSPLGWKSRRIRRVVRSTLAGETLSLADGIDNAVFLSSMFSEIVSPKQSVLPIVCVVDNKSLCDAVISNTPVSDKRLRIEISSIKELMATGQIKALCWSPSKDQLADCLTKPSASALPLLKALQNGTLELQKLTGNM